MGLFVSELMEDSKRQSEAWLITRLVLAIFLYVYVILSTTPHLSLQLLLESSKLTVIIIFFFSFRPGAAVGLL